MKVNFAQERNLPFYFYMTSKITFTSFWQTAIGQHIENFIRIYITVFLTLYLQQVAKGVPEGQDFVLFNWAIIVPAAKWSTLAILSNIYQFLLPPIKVAILAIRQRYGTKRT